MLRNKENGDGYSNSPIPNVDKSKNVTFSSLNYFQPNLAHQVKSASIKPILTKSYDIAFHSNTIINNLASSGC